MSEHRSILLADAVADDRGVVASPGAILLGWPGAGPAAEVLAVGTPAAVQRSAGAVETLDLAGSVLVPGFVNAHCHLDLTAVGPVPLDPRQGFVGWLEAVRRARPTSDVHVAESVRLGVQRSLAGGVVAVGDIAGAWSGAAVGALRTSPLVGVSFLECFGVGGSATAAADRLESLIGAIPGAAADVELGLQPHAPYSAGRGLYERASDLAGSLSLPLSTHLAESRAERELIERGAGPMLDLLDSLGVWDDAAAAEVGHGESPVRHLASVLKRAPWLLAHVNDCSDDDLALLAEAGAAVAYCPRSSAFFDRAAEVGPHRWREMIERGITVALGTDSSASLPVGDQGGLSVLDEAILLRQRDGADPLTLLGMLTTSGARALGLDRDLFRVSPGPIAGVVAVSDDARAGSPMERLFEPGVRPKLIFPPGAAGAPGES